MNCDICHRHHHAQRLPFLCPVDVRNQLYELRLAHALVLIQNEKLEAQVNADLRGAAGVPAETPSTTPTPTPTPTPPSARSRFDALESERQAAVSRTGDVTVRAEQLRAAVDETRAEVARRREALQRRRSDLAAAGNGTAARRVRVLGEVERAIAMTRFRWNIKYDAMAATRGFLCMEAAKLYGLRRVKKGRYELGGLAIVDPYNMNNLPHEVISTSLAHITHILMLACHYLSIRLPAEITLPHRDYPRPTVFTLLSSYAHGDVPFPGTANLHPALAAAAAAGGRGGGSSGGGGGGNRGGRDRDLFQRVPRPRPLFVDKALPLLAKEDSAAHTMFLEGLALLAYDVAWACCSQGVPIGDKAPFDDVFNIGRNLYNLLIGNQRLNNPALRIFATAAAPAGAVPSTTPTATTTTTTAATTTTPAADGTTTTTAAAAAMGRYSHGTAHTFLGDAMMQTFKLPSPNRLADRLKTKLSSESTMPDWEVLEDDAWAVDEDEDRDNMEDGVLPRGGGGGGGGGGSSSSSGGPKNRAGSAAARASAAAAAANGGRGGGTGDGRSSNRSSGPGSGPPEKRLFGVESIATVITSLDETVSEADLDGGPRPAGGGGGKAKGSGTSGWTKLRNRS